MKIITGTRSNWGRLTPVSHLSPLAHPCSSWSLEDARLLVGLQGPFQLHGRHGILTVGPIQWEEQPGGQEQSVLTVWGRGSQKVLHRVSGQAVV